MSKKKKKSESVELKFEVHYDAAGKSDEHVHNILKPVPAVAALPEWFKQLKTDDDPEIMYPTAKQCRGIWDMLSVGYMFVWPFDAEIIRKEDGKLDIIKLRKDGEDAFSPHPHFQMGSYPDPMMQKQSRGIQKLSTPYKIKTPPGTSSMLMQPSYQPDLQTTVMPGIVDTDKYYGEFNVLFMLNDIGDKPKVKIRSGTPLVQVVPFVRGEWSMEYNQIDAERDEINQGLSDNIEKYYQRLLWTKKVYRGAK